jgi:hypothetical protein
MNKTEKSTHQRIASIPLIKIESSDYQRITNARQVTSIANNFDEAKLGTLTVSHRDGKYYLIDGAHRSRALRILGYTHALCIVITGLTYEQEADYFRMQNQDKRPLTPGDLFKAGLASGDEQCKKINHIVKANGFHIGTGRKDFYRLMSIHALYAISEDLGYKVLDDTLFLLANTWSGITKASQSETLLGVAEFVHRYGIAEFAERMRDRFAAVWYEYTEAMCVHGSIGSTTPRIKYCRILVEHYNKGIHHNSKKHLKWEG